MIKTSVIYRSAEESGKDYGEEVIIIETTDYKRSYSKVGAGWDRAGKKGKNDFVSVMLKFEDGVEQSLIVAINDYQRTPQDPAYTMRAKFEGHEKFETVGGLWTMISLGVGWLKGNIRLGGVDYGVIMKRISETPGKRPTWAFYMEDDGSIEDMPAVAPKPKRTSMAPKTKLSSKVDIGKIEPKVEVESATVEEDDEEIPF